MANQYYISTFCRVKDGLDEIRVRAGRLVALARAAAPVFAPTGARAIVPDCPIEG
jgi:hypothetical protein